MADKNMILSADAEEKLLKPIDEYVGKIQAQIDELRVDGSDKVRSLKNHIAIAKEDKNLSKEEKDSIIAKDKAALEKAKAVEAANKDKVAKLIADAEGYLKEHYDSEYYSKVVASCETEKAAENESYERVKATLKTEHEQTLAKLSDPEEIKDEKYVYKNKLFDAQMTHESRLQEIKDRKHDAFSHKYHLIDLLRMSKYTFMQSRAQKFENYKYTFNTTQFLYKNGLYIVIVLIFIALCIITPIVKNTQLLTVTNILNILQQASPRMFLALGVAGLILLTGTDLSIGRMVGMGMVTATIIMHNGANTGGVFGHIFDFSSMPVVGKALFALVACIILTTVFSSIAGFFSTFSIHDIRASNRSIAVPPGYANRVSTPSSCNAFTNIFAPLISISYTSCKVHDNLNLRLGMYICTPCIEKALSATVLRLGRIYSYPWYHLNSDKCLHLSDTIINYHCNHY